MRFGHIRDWDISQITNMSYAFANCDTFNEDISGWNVKNVVTMASMSSTAPSHSINRLAGGTLPRSKICPDCSAEPRRSINR